MAVRQIDLLQGTLDLLILKSLGSGANHGYGIALRIHQLSDDVLRVEEGSLYPALYRMEEHGLIQSEWRTTENNRKAKFYKLTRKGMHPPPMPSCRAGGACHGPSARGCARSNKEPDMPVRPPRFIRRLVALVTWSGRDCEIRSGK